MANGSYGYKDNYPHNIEAPQRVNFQYSQDIVFDYSNGKFPLGETHEGFLWEDVYIPVEHTVGSETVGRHVWMRQSIGLNNDWTLPIRLTDSFTNIEGTDIQYDIGEGTASFRFKYTLADGTVIYSEYITIQNGVDGRGISDANIVGTDLIFDYTDNTTENLGRVVGFDGVGLPIGSPDNYHLISVGNVPLWQDFNVLLNSELSANSPLDFTASLLTHLDTDGNKHVPVGGNSGDSLITDGAGNYSWEAYILLSDLDDTATTGDTDKVYSADKILSLVGGAAGFGIKYSETTKVLLDLITGSDNELGVVTNDPLYPNRTVFQWSGGGGGDWGSGFFDLDATHNHDSRYYTETELGSSGTASYVHWDKVFSKPTFFIDWTIAGDTGSTDISDGETLSILGGSGVTTALAGNTLTINATGTTYTAGIGLDLVGTEFRHEDTSSVSNTTNTNGVVIQNLTFDTFGHVLTRTSLNLDGRYSLLGHTHGDTRMLQTIIDIGDWNMLSTAIKTISHSITFSKIREVTAMIRNDSNTVHYPLVSIEFSGHVNGAIRSISSTTINLERAPGEKFDAATFDATGYNRGWVIIHHIA